jgi:hypothetical protein
VGHVGEAVVADLRGSLVFLFGGDLFFFDRHLLLRLFDDGGGLAVPAPGHTLGLGLFLDHLDLFLLLLFLVLLALLSLVFLFLGLFLLVMFFVVLFFLLLGLSPA